MMPSPEEIRCWVLLYADGRQCGHQSGTHGYPGTVDLHCLRRGKLPILRTCWRYPQGFSFYLFLHAVVAHVRVSMCMRASVCNVRQACTCTLSHDASRNGSGNLVLNSPERRPPLFTERRLVAFVQHQPRGAFFCNAQVQERRLVRFWCVHISSNILSSFAMFKKYGFPGFESRHASAREEDSSRAVVHGCCRGHSSVSGSDDEDDSQDDHAEQPDHSGRWHDSAR